MKALAAGIGLFVRQRRRTWRLCTITFPLMRIVIIGGAPIWRWPKTLQNHAERNCQSRDASSSCERWAARTRQRSLRPAWTPIMNEKGIGEKHDRGGVRGSE